MQSCPATCQESTSERGEVRVRDSRERPLRVRDWKLPAKTRGLHHILWQYIYVDWFTLFYPFLFKNKDQKCLLTAHKDTRTLQHSHINWACVGDSDLGSRENWNERLTCRMPSWLRHVRSTPCLQNTYIRVGKQEGKRKMKTIKDTKKRWLGHRKGSTRQT